MGKQRGGWAQQFPEKAEGPGSKQQAEHEPAACSGQERAAAAARPQLRVGQGFYLLLLSVPPSGTAHGEGLDQLQQAQHRPRDCQGLQRFPWGQRLREQGLFALEKGWGRGTPNSSSTSTYGGVREDGPGSSHGARWEEELKTHSLHFSVPIPVGQSENKG